MATQVVMPQMGESIAEGTITKWLKGVGDRIDKDEALLEISTDKVDTEIPAPAAGTLGKILTEEGATVEVGTPIAVILAEGESADDADDAGPPPDAEASSDEEQEPEGKGGKAAKAEPAKAQDEAPSKASKREPEQPAHTAGRKQQPERAREPAEAGAAVSALPRQANGRFLSPLVRSIAAANRLGVDELGGIEGSGAGGRVTGDDVLRYLEARPAAGAAPSAAGGGRATAGAFSTPVPVFGEAPGDETVEIDRMRGRIAHHMVESVKTSAHVYILTDCDMSAIVEFRNRHKESFAERTGVKLTYTPFFLKASALALRDFPMVNAQMDLEAGTITRKGAVNVGMATALPRDDGSFGLIVPVIRNADMLPLREIARQVNDLATRARSNELKPDEPQGGTFTVTNMGTFGSYGGMPIINQPQVAILGVGAIQKRPVVRDDEIVARDMVFLSVGIDHRLVDGALGGQFLERIRWYLENFETWILA